MSLTAHCGAAVGAAQCAGLSEVSRLSSRRRCAVSGPRTSTRGWLSRLYEKEKGARPPKFTRAKRREIKKIAKSKPAEHDLPFSTWSLSKLAEFLVAEGVVDDISHEGLRALLRQEGVTFQRLKTWKASTDPDYAVNKARVTHLSAISHPDLIPPPAQPKPPSS